MVEHPQPSLRIDYGLALDSGSKCGLKDELLAEAQGSFATALKAVLADVAAGTLGFWTLPSDEEKVEGFADWAKSVPDSIKDILVLGIGGSSLGGRALYEALGGPPELRRGRRLHFPDNSDPWRLNHLLDALKPEQTFVIVISKSGGTVETAAALLVVRQWLREGGVTMAEHLLAITDPKSGSLRKLADQEGLRTESVPGNVGGRFSVLTAVGLLPAAWVGFDVQAIRAGADAMRKRCEIEELQKNPAGLLAVLQSRHHLDHGRHIHVLMPYADALRGVAAWFVQLWAESLGKRVGLDGAKVEQGPTPLPAAGATDQHAQVQLFMEGPRDKLVTFVAIEKHARDMVIPREEGANAYLGGHSLCELLDAEQRATAQALAEDGRPSITLKLPELNEHTLGQLLFLWQATTAIAGRLYGVNAFDQPGVELGKVLAFGLLGREGYEKERARVAEAERARPKRLC